MIGLDANLNPVPTVLELAQERGMSVGIVTTTAVSNATPAGFLAHVQSRYFETEIAGQYLTSEANVILGGGENVFLPTSKQGCYPSPGERKDGRDLIQEFESRGYTHVCTASEFRKIDPGWSMIRVTPITLILLIEEMCVLLGSSASGTSNEKLLSRTPL